MIGLVASYVNHHDTEDVRLASTSLLLTALAERAGSVARDYEGDFRCSPRASLQQGVNVVPIVDGDPDKRQMFPAVTSDFSSTGIGLLAAVDPRRGPIQLTLYDGEQQVIIDGEIRWTECLGAGFYRIGVEASRCLPPTSLAGRDTETANQFAP